jgi:hypothetical protein
MKELRNLLDLLISLKKEDKQKVDDFIRMSLDVISGRLYDNLPTASSYKYREIYRLAQFGNWEPIPNFEVLVRVVLCRRSDHILKSVNPFLNDDDVEVVYTSTLQAMAISVRYGHTLKCIQQLKRLLRTLRKFWINPAPTISSELNDAFHVDRAAIWRQQIEVAKLLASKRSYVSLRTTKENIYFEFDPRLLAFEFAHNLVIRRPQIAMIDEFMTAKREERSMVMQMIMVSLFIASNFVPF